MMMLSDTKTDYGPSLIEALNVSSKKSSVWNNRAESITCKYLKQRAKKAPMYAKAAAFASTLMPMSYLLQVPSIKASMPVAPSGLELGPKPEQGLQSWYWVYGRMAGATYTDPNAAVFLMVKQVVVDPISGINVWTVTAGGENPADSTWISKKTIFIDDRHVRRILNGVVVTSPHVSCRLVVSTKGFSATVTYPEDGFSFAMNVSSKRGPTYQQ